MAATSSTWQRAPGRRPGKGADSGQQLTFGNRTALLDLNPALAGVAGVVGTNVVREVLDHFAVPYQQQVVLDRHSVSDVIEEAPHVFIAMALAAMLFGRWSSG
jgi:hypothetical protein